MLSSSVLKRITDRAFCSYVGTDNAVGPLLTQAVESNSLLGSSAFTAACGGNCQDALESNKKNSLPAWVPSRSFAMTPSPNIRTGDRADRCRCGVWSRAHRRPRLPLHGRSQAPPRPHRGVLAAPQLSNSFCITNSSSSSYTQLRGVACNVIVCLERYTSPNRHYYPPYSLCPGDLTSLLRSRHGITSVARGDGCGRVSRYSQQRKLETHNCSSCSTLRYSRSSWW